MYPFKLFLHVYTRTSLLYIGEADVYADDIYKSVVTKYIDELPKIWHMLWSNYEYTCIDIEGYAYTQFAAWKTAFQRILSQI